MAELLVLIVIGAIVVALGIAMAPVILPLLGWGALLVAIIAGGGWFLGAVVEEMPGFFASVSEFYRRICHDAPRDLLDLAREPLPPLRRTARLAQVAICTAVLIPVILTVCLGPLLLLATFIAIVFE